MDDHLQQINKVVREKVALNAELESLETQIGGAFADENVDRIVEINGRISSVRDQVQERDLTLYRLRRDISEQTAETYTE